MEVNAQLHAPAALPQEKNPGTLVGPHSRSGRFGEHKKFLAPTEIQTPDLLANSLVAIPTMVLQVSFKVYVIW
jgi:hypothetical protein